MDRMQKWMSRTVIYNAASDEPQILFGIDCQQILQTFPKLRRQTVDNLYKSIRRLHSIT